MSSTMKIKKPKLVNSIPGHPNVRTIQKEEDLSIHEQINRYVHRMESYPRSIDTIHRALTTMLLKYDDDTNAYNFNDKYRNIDTSTAVYKQNIENIPGAESLLLALKFKNVYKNNDHGMNDSEARRQRYLTIEPNDIHSNTNSIRYAISELVNIQQNSILYQNNKQIERFNNEIRTVVKTDADSYSDESQQRLYYKSLCLPDNSTETGLGTMIEVRFGDVGTKNCRKELTVSPTTETVPIMIVHRHKFNSDDTVLDVLHWLGSIGGNILFNKLSTGEWVLVDLSTTTSSKTVNQINTGSVDCSSKYIQSSTLQSIGLWPSGRLSVRPKMIHPIYGSSTTTCTSTTSRNWVVNNRALGIPSSAS